MVKSPSRLSDRKCPEYMLTVRKRLTLRSSEIIKAMYLNSLPFSKRIAGSRFFLTFYMMSLIQILIQSLPFRKLFHRKGRYDSRMDEDLAGHPIQLQTYSFPQLHGQALSNR